jgi:hypothetical protein
MDFVATQEAPPVAVDLDMLKYSTSTLPEDFDRVKFVTEEDANVIVCVDVPLTANVETVVVDPASNVTNDVVAWDDNVLNVFAPVIVFAPAPS